MLDDDVINFDDSDLVALNDMFSSKKDIGAICFKVIDYYTGNICNWCHHYEVENYSEKEFITDEISEGAVAFRKEAFIRAGLYPEQFFISHEGVDLCCRLLDIGYKTIYSPKVTVKHFTAKEGRKSWRRYYYDTRNQFFVAARNYPVGFGLKYLVKGQAMMMIYSIRDGFLKYYLKGVFDGISMLKDVFRERKRLSNDTMAALKKIAQFRPSLAYMLRKRLFRNQIKI